MEIGGKYQNKMITRCCEMGKWQFQSITSSGAGSCPHTGYSEFWDFLDTSKLEPATKEMIKEAKEQEQIEIKRCNDGWKACDTLSKDELRQYDIIKRLEEIDKIKQDILDYVKKNSLSEKDYLKHFNKLYSQQREEKLKEIRIEIQDNNASSKKITEMFKEYNDLLK